MATYNSLYLSTRRRLKAAGFPGASLEARELVCYGSGKTREEFFRDAPLPAPAEVERTIEELARRHLQGEPVAYLIGEWEFYGLTLEINSSVLIPRTDTEVLAREAIAYIAGLGGCRVLDLCAGSGCLGLAAAANAPDCQVLLGEISEPAAHVCRRNISRCGLAERVSVTALDALRPPPEELGRFSCVMCNPPYIPRGDMETLDSSVKDYEPRLALCGGEDGLDFYRSVARDWKAALTPGGRLYFEVGVGQAEMVSGMMRSEGFEAIHVIPDDQSIPRVVYGAFGHLATA